jgi:hypothetical protein
VLANVGFVPQLPPPLKMPVGQLIDFAAGLCGTAPARIHDIARRLGLDLDAILLAPVRPPVGRHEAEAADRDRARARGQGC